MLRKAFQFADAKSDKFWRIETLEACMAVNFGKTGTTGRYQLKEFDSEEECEKEAVKLISQKVKKGYKEDSEFDFINHLYFDDDEFGLHPLTSHPHFREHFTHDLYFDCCDEEAPFGSDEGSDALADIEELMRKKGMVDFVLYPQSLIENEWGMTYIPVADMDEAAVKDLIAKDEMNLIQSDMITYSAAFAQIKITGTVSEELKKRALLAIKRIDMVAKLNGWMKMDTSEISNIVSKDLLSFDKYR